VDEFRGIDLTTSEALGAIELVKFDIMNEAFDALEEKIDRVKPPHKEQIK